MLRSTGFFRSIDCPYWAGAPGGPCRRPYCHFRHRGARGPGAPGSGGAASPASGLGYDPYNPELPQPPVQRENGALGQGDGMLELELVNQAIEAVRGEVELEQRRYQELLETARGHSAGPSALAPCSPATSIDDDDTFSLALTYTPGGLLSPDAAYQPTPLAVPAEPGHKYSLAPSDRSQGRAAGGAGALEYVPEPGSQPLKTRTLSGMASKTTTTVTPKRIAHSPSLQSLKKPVIPKEFGGKVPTVVRQRYLNLFIEECLKFCSSNQEAIEKALNEEKVAYDRSPSKNIYLNVAVNTLKKLRGLVPNTVPNLSKASGRRVVSHEVVLGGKLAAKTSFSLSRPSSPRVEELKGTALYSRLREYLLTQEQLKENGYPFPHPERPGGAIIFTAEEKKPKDPSCRICCRCGTEYLVSSSGRCVRSEECYYHWGRLRRNRVAGGWETQYMCCSAPIPQPRCPRPLFKLCNKT